MTCHSCCRWRVAITHRPSTTPPPTCLPPLGGEVHTGKHRTGTSGKPFLEIALSLLVNLHTVPVGFRNVEAILSVERDRYGSPEIRLGLGRDVVGRVEVRWQGWNEV